MTSPGVPRPDSGGGPSKRDAAANSPDRRRAETASTTPPMHDSGRHNAAAVNWLRRWVKTLGIRPEPRGGGASALRMAMDRIDPEHGFRPLHRLDIEIHHHRL